MRDEYDFAGGKRGKYAPTCRCALAVKLDYTGFDQAQVWRGLRLIEEMGEWTAVFVAGTWYRVSRHCIMLHGINAVQITAYGFEILKEG